MSRVQQKTRASTRLSHTLKRHYDDTDEGGFSVRGPNIESHDETYGDDFITWKLTLNTTDQFTMSVDNENFVGDDRTFHFGRIGETFYLEGNTFVFHGSSITRSKMQFILPDGRLSISWYGGQLIIDETYSLVERNLTQWHQSPGEMPRLRQMPIYVRGGRADPITLSHVGRSYIIRLNDSYPAVVTPRCAYYPLKLALWRDFVAQMDSSEAGERKPVMPLTVYNETRVPPPTPHTPCTPRTNRSSESAISDQTPPSQYVDNDYTSERNETTDEQSTE